MGTLKGKKKKTHGEYNVLLKWEHFKPHLKIINIILYTFVVI